MSKKINEMNKGNVLAALRKSKKNGDTGSNHVRRLRHRLTELNEK